MVDITTAGILKIANAVKATFSTFKVTIDSIEETVPIFSNIVVDGTTIRVSLNIVSEATAKTITLVKLIDSDSNIFAQETMDFVKPAGKPWYKSFDFKITALEV